jgi:hypothetical protein
MPPCPAAAHSAAGVGVQEAARGVEEQQAHGHLLHQRLDTARARAQRHHLAVQVGGVLHGGEFGGEALHVRAREALVIPVAEDGHEQVAHRPRHALAAAE